MTCRDEILHCVQRLFQQSSKQEFTVQEVVEAMQASGTTYAESTIRTHITSRLCANAPNHHGVTYPDFVRISHGIYKRAI